MKRVLDVFLAAGALLVLCVPLMLVAVAVRVALGRPILFRQMRPGLRGKPFAMFKFRSMTTELDEQGKLLPDSQRLTRFGRFLRSTSLDEAPALLNVLRGEMSLVGPRPLLMEYLPLYNAFQSRRHEVRPGVTGWAQVNGRNAVDWKDRFEMDVWYVDNQSLWLDLKILALTVRKVVAREGISARGEATMPKFTGNE